jgi:hypothetical protein
MKIASVTEARDYGDKQPLPGLTGKVKHVFETKTGTSAKGDDWTMQGIVLSDPADPKIEVTLTLWNHAPYDDSIKGKTITVMPGPKGGLVGAEPYEKTKKDGSTETIYKVQANRSCDVTFGGGAPAAKAPAQQAARQATQQAGPGPKVTQPPPTTAGKRWTWNEFLDEEGVIMEMCINKAAAIASSTAEAVGQVCGTGFEPDQIASIASSLRIEAGKAGLNASTPIKAAAPNRPAPAPVATDDPPAEDDGSDNVPF